MTRPALLIGLVSGVLGPAIAVAQLPAPAPMPAPPPLTQPELERAVQAGARGTLAIRVTQGTAGGPEVGAAEIEVHLFHRDQVIQRIDARLDEHGVALVGDLPIAMGIRPVVRVKHAGVVYQDVGPLMDPDAPQAAVDVTVYEVTDETPPWRVSTRRVVAKPTPLGIAVSESVVVENPADRTWLGGDPLGNGKRPTVVLSLPPEASDVRLEAGFHGWCCTVFEGGRLAVQMPLMPGKASYRFSYHAPTAGGRADLRVSAPAPMDHATFFVPDDGSTAEPVGVTPAGVETNAGSRMRLFHAESLPPGQAAGVVLANLVIAAAPTRSRDAAPGASTEAMVVAGVGLLAAGVGIVAFVRARRLRVAARPGLGGPPP